MPENKQKLENIEIKLLLDGIYEHYGWDFRNYAMASLKRRIWKCIHDEKLTTVSGFQERVLHYPDCFERLLLTISIDMTSMFRDPGFFLSFRKNVVPLLNNLPFIRIWHAGCSTGEEVYSMAILLKEEGLYEKSRLYATDMNESILQKAKSRIVPLKEMQDNTNNYLSAGGTRSFSDYYISQYDNAIFKSSLQNNIVWAQHNLVTDSSFNEFHVILCRNVMIYFNHSLQNHVHKLIYDSLALRGILGLGSKESLKFTPYSDCYEELNGKEKIYTKVK